MKVNKAFMSTGLLAALASSLCCIAPLLAIIGGVSVGASMFSWVEPFRPYLIGVSILALGYAFYQAYKPKAADDCGCDVPVKKSILNSKGFLWTVTLLSLLLFTFPYYASAFYSSPQNNTNETILLEANQELNTAKLWVVGMTCASCENHVNHALSKVEGVFFSETSSEDGTTIVQFNPEQTSIEDFSKMIEQETGYTVEKSEIIIERI